jgi:hypothetical protein
MIAYFSIFFQLTIHILNFLKNKYKIQKPFKQINKINEPIG